MDLFLKYRFAKHECSPQFDGVQMLKWQRYGRNNLSFTQRSMLFVFYLRKFCSAVNVRLFDILNVRFSDITVTVILLTC